jgi:ABC-2 type transport system permease protein
MRGLVPICKRELLALFVTPVAWVVMTAFLLLHGFFFFLLLANFAQSQDVITGGGPIEAFFGQTALFYLPLVFVCPVLTMRLFAEERRTGTIEALLTAPVTSTGVVLGKYLAAMITYVAIWAPTGLYVAVLSRFGEVDVRIVATGYLGTLLVGAAYIGIGTLASALTTSQITAAVGASGFILLLFGLGFGEFFLEAGPTRDFASHVSVWALMNDMSRGLVDTRRLVFWGPLAVLPVFVTVRTVESWRWG